MNEAIAHLPWTDRQWDMVHQAVKTEAERTRIPAKSLRCAKADPTDVAVAAYALGTNDLPLAGDPRANEALLDALTAAGKTKPQRPDVDSDPTVYLTSISKLVYLRNREIADQDLDAALTYFRRAGAELAQAENALLLNGRTRAALRQAPAGVTVNRIPNGARGLLNPLNPPDVRVSPPSPSLITSAGGGLAAFGAQLAGAVTQATTQLEGVPYHAPYAMVASSIIWRILNQPAATSLVPARPAIERALMGGPLLQSSLLPEGWALVMPHDCPELEQVVARDLGVKFLQMSEEPRAIFRVSLRTALRVRDWKAVASIRLF